MDRSIKFSLVVAVWMTVQTSAFAQDAEFDYRTLLNAPNGIAVGRRAVPETPRYRAQPLQQQASQDEPPFRTAQLIEDCIQPVLCGSAALTATAIRQVIGPADLVRLEADGRIRPSYDAPRTVFLTTGCVMARDLNVTSTEVSRLFAIEAPLTLEIDTPADMIQAERILSEGRWSPKELHRHEGLSVA